MTPLDTLLPTLLTLVILGVPIALAFRWVTKRYEPGAGANSPELPTREQFEALAGQVESLSQRLEDLDERHVFLERLLEKPRAAGRAGSAGTGGGDETS
jgi:hypothetical protein